MYRKACLLAAFLAVSACGGSPRIAMAPMVEQAPHNELPAPDGVGPDGRYIYGIGPLDTLSIEVDGMPDLLRQIVVDGQGMISYPMAGSISASGLTTTQLARAVEERMRENHVRDPKVSVNLVTPASNIITVDGEVNKPGLYPVANDMTLVQAVALAGSNTGFARTSVVLVFREVEGQQFVGLYDLKAIRLGNYADPKIYPNDKIVVSESAARRLIEAAQPLMGLITAPLIYLIRR